MLLLHKIKKIGKRRNKVNERSLSVLEQYDIAVTDVFHGRGSFICRTDKGRKLLCPFHGSDERAALLYSLQLKRKSLGERFVDLPMPTKEGNFVSVDMYGNRFILKDWVETVECDINDISQLEAAMKALACFHKAFHLTEDDELYGKFSEYGSSFSETVAKHNREISKVFRYIRTKNNKTNFEFSFLHVGEAFLSQGKAVADSLSSGDYEKLYEDAKEKGLFNHGDFSHHEVLMIDQHAFVVHPEHFQCAVQIEDLAHIMRKVMEKNDWDINVGERMLEAYDRERTLISEERIFLKLKLTYPEKFWKLANHYFNSKKSWISARQEEKLEKLIEQDKKKQLFLENVL